MVLYYSRGKGEDHHSGIPLRAVWTQVGAATRGHPQGLSALQEPVLGCSSKDSKGPSQSETMTVLSRQRRYQLRRCAVCEQEIGREPFRSIKDKKGHRILIHTRCWPVGQKWEEVGRARP